MTAHDQTLAFFEGKEKYTHVPKDAEHIMTFTARVLEMTHHSFYGINFSIVKAVTMFGLPFKEESFGIHTFELIQTKESIVLDLCVFVSAKFTKYQHRIWSKARFVQEEPKVKIENGILYRLNEPLPDDEYALIPEFWDMIGRYLHINSVPETKQTELYDYLKEIKK